MRTAPQMQISDEIPTSSMADVAFLLIIFFMVTLTFSATRGLDFRFPEPSDAMEVDPVESVFVEVVRGGALRVDGRSMPVELLLGYLQPRLEANPAKPVIVKPLADAEYGHMVRVLDELRQGKEKLLLAQEINIALPTEREISQLWE